MENLLSRRFTPPSLFELIPPTRIGTLEQYGHKSWHAVAQDPRLFAAVEQITDTAAEYRNRDMPVLTDELYTEFSRTGSRQGFERAYFERRQMLGYTAVAALVDGREPVLDYYFTTLVSQLTTILDEESWALPAHVYNPTGRDPQYIDLFAAETAYTMAELCHVFATVIPTNLQRRILERLRSTIFQPYIEHADDYHFTHDTHNWNAVCHQGVLGSALLIEPNSATVAQMLSVASDRLGCFLDGFTRDGGCTEGPGYWQYGFGRFSALNQLIERVTHNALSLFCDDERIARIAQYPLHVILSNDYVANFSDCARRLEFAPWLMQYLGYRLNVRALCEYATSTFDRACARKPFPSDPYADFFQLSRLLTVLPVSNANVRSAMADTYMPDLQILCAHRADSQGRLWELAAKAGHNAEHHNHNDCGSYLLNIAGTPIALELGAPEYTRDYFGPSRYSFLAARSTGHSVPIINGCEQAAGEEFRARVVKCDVTGHTLLFATDLTECYPTGADCSLLVREILLDAAAARLEITDRFVLSDTGMVESTLILADGAMSESSAGLLINIGTLRLTLTTGPECHVKTVERLLFRSVNGEETTVQRVIIGSTKAMKEGVLQYSLASRIDG